MMKNNEIQDWLSIPEAQRDYFVGIELYKKYGDNPRLKNLVFTSDKNFPGNLKSLSYELSKLVSKTTAKKKVIIIGAPSQETQLKEVAKLAAKKVKNPVKTVKVQSTEQTLKNEFPQIDFATLPNELKILVIDRITLFKTAKEAKAALDAADNEADRFKYNKLLVDSMLENQKIWDELNYYQSNKKVLGKHSLFARAKDIEKLQAMSRKQLFNLKQNIPSYISKANTAIKENPKDKKLIARKRKLLESYAWKEKEIDRLLSL